MRIRKIQKEDIQDIAKMRCQLWPDNLDDEIRELNNFFSGARNHICEVFVLESEKNELCGFIELNIRTMIDISDDPIAYVEGWFISEKYRRKGFGKKLMKIAEHWALENGFTKIYSDTDILNEISIKSHKALGFKELERFVLFEKNLNIEEKK